MLITIGKVALGFVVAEIVTAAAKASKKKYDARVVAKALAAPSTEDLSYNGWEFEAPTRKALPAPKVTFISGPVATPQIATECAYERSAQAIRDEMEKKIQEGLKLVREAERMEKVRAEEVLKAEDEEKMEILAETVRTLLTNEKSAAANG